MSESVVQAAGGVIWRAGLQGTEIVLVHRPKYDDWTLPKGKLERGETHEQAARREVLEETGLVVELGNPLVTTTYTDAAGRPKEVRYWAMPFSSGEFTQNDEVDELRWLSIDAAQELLSYPRDVDVLISFVT